MVVEWISHALEKRTNKKTLNKMLNTKIRVFYQALKKMAMHDGEIPIRVNMRDCLCNWVVLNICLYLIIMFVAHQKFPTLSSKIPLPKGNILSNICLT